MLDDEAKKIEIRDNDNMPWWDMGVLLFNRADGRFYEIMFGDGSDDEPIEGCDDYLYITVYAVVNGGDFEEEDGGNMWFNREKSGYSGYINDEKMIRDALEFVGCKEPDASIYLKRV